MNDPVSEIPYVINTLCTATPRVQRQCIERYFTPNASFTHPLCRTGSFEQSRWLILQIYRWYKILSPRIVVTVDSVAFDESNLLLYVSIRQTFKIVWIPFYRADVALVTVLGLTTYLEPSGDPTLQEHNRDNNQLHHQKQSMRSAPSHGRYYITSQNDLYQTTEWIKFVLPWSIGYTLLMLAHFWATAMCVLGAVVGWPITWVEERLHAGESSSIDLVDHDDNEGWVQERID